MLLKDILKNVNLTCNVKLNILALNTLEKANKNEVSFLENKKYIKDLKNTKAGAVFVKKEYESLVPSNTVALVCEEPYINLAKISKLFASKTILSQGKKAKIGSNTIIMPNVNIGFNVSIGDNCTILSGAYIGDNVSIGSNTIIQANVVIYKECIIGNDCLIHAGSIIGSDGFGFAQKNGKYIKIYQNGNVIIGNDVEIGSNCAIDRAVFDSTIISNGVRIDNLVHIAHNCFLGEGCILTGQVGLAGSSVLKQYVQMGAQSGIAGHLEIAAFTIISARGGVTKDIKDEKAQWSGFPLMKHKQWLRLQGKISQLLKR